MAARKRIKTEAGELEFDQTEYDELWAHYYNVVVVKNVELPGGRTLREQRRPPRIERKSPGFKQLRARLKELQRQGDHGRIFQLLSQLREWEMCPQSLGGATPGFMREEEAGGQAAVAEVVNLVDEVEVLDVDKFISAVLLVGVTKVRSMSAVVAHP